MTTRLTRYAADLKGALEARLVPLEGGPLDGTLMMSAGVMQEAIASVPEPPPDEHQAELATPATVYLDAMCHICGERTRVMVRLESKTLVDDKRRTIAAKVDTAAADHLCGQLPLTVGPEVEGQSAFDWTIPVGDVLEDPVHVADMLHRVGVEASAEAVDGWTEAERAEAASWAVAAHVAQSAGEDPPARPEHVAALPLSGIDDHADQPDPTEVCPFPGCTRAPEHRGGHKGADGKPIRPPKADADGDLLPE